MAVPKKKTSKSKRDMRRSHLALGKINVVIDKESGEYRLPHHVSLKDGTYNGREVIAAKIVDDSDED
jgi:large subunit ribosomal protein L32